MIGVAVSTMNRRDVFRETIDHWRKHLPADAVLIVVDDASDTPVPPIDGVTVIRHTYRRGIAMTKNRCIAELIDAGCTDLFLADDDICPVADTWWQPYVASPEPHLSYQWPREGSDNPWTITHNDGHHFSIGFPRGVLLYATREVIDTVGGMDPAYGAHGGEHVEWSHRIHTAGLTRWPYADVCGSDQLWYSLDKQQGGSVGSTLPLADRITMSRNNSRLWDKPRTFIPYREDVGVQDYDLGPRISDTHVGVLNHVLAQHPAGTGLEFGVGEGHSLRRIAHRMPAIGFDSFNGLPEKWRDGFDVGMFACPPPDIPNTRLVDGLFVDTLPGFDWESVGHVGLVHLDADLYSSTATVLDHITQVLRPGTYVVMDEYHGYPGADGEHEQRAWREFADRTGIGWTVLGHGPEQLALRIL